MASFALFSIVFTFIISSCCGVETKTVSKRNDIDLQTCIDSFNVHKDKIIRTQDSRDMGAKYINEIDLGSREECLRLCCETENCDVFVFEEKTTGSCYLFQCGPPEDFKCKFTHHANYSSAILAVNKHLPDLEREIKLTKHEKDLNQLRKSETKVEVNTKTHEIETTPITTSTTRIKYIFTPTKDTLDGKKSNKDRKCSRYQFECRSTKECIAIYNACDGIPQCADGSDEAPELGCPEGATTTPTTPSIINNHVFEASNSRVPIEPIRNGPESRLKAHNSPKVEPDFVRPEPRNNFVQHTSFDRDPPPGPPYRPIQAQSQNSWIPRPPNYDPQQFQPYDERNIRFFNHKENGLQVPDDPVNRYISYRGAMQNMHRAPGYSLRGQSQYGTVNNNHEKSYLGGEYHPPGPQYQEGWQSNPSEDRYYANRYNPAETANQDWSQNTKDKETDENKQFRYDEGELHTNKDRDHEHEKMAHQLKHSKELMPKAVKNSEATVTIEKAAKHVYNAELYKQDGDLQDGIAQTPGGAVLSLTLGLIITCVMAILIGCRLRLVKRRLRRGVGRWARCLTTKSANTNHTEKNSRKLLQI